MYMRFVYENSILGSGMVTILNRYAGELLASPVELHIKDCGESLRFGTGSNQEIAPSSFEVRKAMLQAERRKAEALNMLRLKETMQ